VRLDPRTQHTTKYCRIGRIRADRQFDIIHDSGVPIAPDPYPEIAFPGWSVDWTKGGVTRGAEVDIHGDV
jgi:urea transport system substrate-binding protein